MRKPIDPRNHGLKQPNKLITYAGRIHSDTLDQSAPDSEKLSLRSFVTAWEKVLREAQTKGHRPIGEACFERGHFGSIWLKYTLGYDNESYTAEMAEYVAKVTTYERNLVEYRKWLEKDKNTDSQLSVKIERAKQRLANLEATRDGLPLPYSGSEEIDDEVQQLKSVLPS
jgi:hypothetical protein